MQIHRIGLKGATVSAMLFIFFLAFVCSVSAKDDVDAMQFASEDYCSITEPVYGHKFDFNGLHSDLAHVVEGEYNDVFEFNVCGNLTHSCNGETNVAACLKKGGKEYVLGHQHELKYSTGRMYFNYTSGAKCENGTIDIPNYRFHVVLYCDYTPDANPIKILSHSDSACSFYVTYSTPLACIPIPDAMQSNSCSVQYTQTGKTFDLMPLSNTISKASDRQGNTFWINVCKPVQYGQYSMCPAGSSICLFSPKATDPKKRFINYGNVQTKPTVKDGQLSLRHESSTPCDKNSSMTYISVIYFFCDRNAYNARAEFVGLDEDSCTNVFNYVTPQACEDLKDCTGITHGNELMDLSPLIGHGVHKLSKDGKDYTVAACTDAGAPCMAGEGACYKQNGQTNSLGKLNSHLRFNQSGSPYLLYEDGGHCGTGERRWSTKIEFVCANNATKDNGNTSGSSGDTTATNTVKIIEDSNCQLLIQYQTPYACQEQIKCTDKGYAELSGDFTIDLTPLINANENYEASTDLPAKQAEKLSKNTKFFLNVCRPLVPKYQLGCAGGSGACMAKMSAAGAPEEEQSLGFPLASLKAINQTDALLLYLRGDPCPSDKSTEISTEIHFTCNMRAGRGHPVLNSIDDCHYGFHWDTSVICPPHECLFGADTCEIVQDELNLHYNFSQAPFTKNGKIEIEYKQRKVEVNICGVYRKAVTDYSQDLVNLFFAHDLPGCGKEGKMNVHMRVICSSSTHNSSTITDDQQCSLLYVQHTPSICQFLGLSVPPLHDNPDGSNTGTSRPETPTASTTPTPTAGKNNNSATVTTEGPAAGAGAGAGGEAAHLANVPSPRGSVGTILVVILSVTFFVACVGMFAFSPARRQRVRRLFRRNNSAVRYSVVQSNEEANLLLEPNGEFTESDDDMLL